ncbi:MAG TPA: SRPBCC domain-containing protein [Puia sp.]|nr:SRPBCC domain-containing protein [Puia sp.]
MWNEFKLRIGIDAPLATIYKAWSTPGGLESWFLRKALLTPSDQAPSGQPPHRAPDDPIQPGDHYEWYWHGHPDTVAHKGTILRANGKDLFQFSFSLDCPVTVSLYRECDETIVELRESEFPAGEKAMKHYVEDSKGWIFYLANLKSILEGGLDLRNRKVELTNVINS